MISNSIILIYIIKNNLRKFLKKFESQIHNIKLNDGRMSFNN